MSDKIIDIQNLKVTFHDEYGPRYAVRNLNLALYQGETLAIVGESGSGKSVTMRSLLGLLPSNAKIEADCLNYQRTSLLNLKPREFNKIRSRKISMVFQDPLSALNPTMRIGRQIGEVLQHRHQPYRKLKAKVNQQLRDVGLTDTELIAHKYPHELSGGQRQRVMIAMALVGDPEVLIADEPTTALDVTLQAQILKLIQTQKKKYDLSVLFVTHDLGVVADIADRVAIMYAGEVVEIGTAEEIFYYPQHPYTWGLLEAVPGMDENNDELFTLSGTPPDLRNDIVGDAFAARNPYALAIDFEEKPPLVQLSETHFVRSWLLDKRAPAYQPPAVILSRWQTYKQLNEGVVL